jgi:hypothetical protein
MRSLPAVIWASPGLDCEECVRPTTLNVTATADSRTEIDVIFAMTDGWRQLGDLLRRE